jgi:hypothetical protein
MNCKWDAKSDCKLTELVKRELVDRDCFFCVAFEMKGVSQRLIEILCGVGAKEFALQFAEEFISFVRCREIFFDLAEKYYPELVKMAKKRAEEATVVVPKEFEEALRKWLDRAKDGVV